MRWFGGANFSTIEFDACLFCKQAVREQRFRGAIKNPVCRDGVRVMLLERLYSSTFFDCFCGVCLLTAQPINNGYKGEYDAYPVHGRANRFNNVLKGPLKAIGYWSEDALEVHG